MAAVSVAPSTPEVPWKPEGTEEEAPPTPILQLDGNTEEDYSNEASESKNTHNEDDDNDNNSKDSVDLDDGHEDDESIEEYVETDIDIPAVEHKKKFCTTHTNMLSELNIMGGCIPFKAKLAKINQFEAMRDFCLYCNWLISYLHIFCGQIFGRK